MNSRHVLFSFIALSVAFGVACSDAAKKEIGDSCANNTDCADTICHSGICVSQNPLTNGVPCDGDGFCKSLKCEGGICAQNNRGAGVACLNGEECSASVCQAGICGGSVITDDAGGEQRDGGGALCAPIDPKGCDPVAGSGCTAGGGCYLDAQGLGGKCVCPAGTKNTGDSCTTDAECKPGNACVGQYGGPPPGTCTSVCKTGPDGTCTGGEVCMTRGDGIYGVCGQPG